MHILRWKSWGSRGLRHARNSRAASSFAPTHPRSLHVCRKSWRHESGKRRRRVKLGLWSHPWRKMSWNTGPGVQRIIIQKSIVGCCHFPMLGSIIVVPNICIDSAMRLSALAHTFLEVEYSKRAHITNAIDMERELPKEVDNLLTALRQTEPEDKRRDYNTQYLF